MYHVVNTREMRIIGSCRTIKKAYEIANGGKEYVPTIVVSGTEAAVQEVCDSYSAESLYALAISEGE